MGVTLRVSGIDRTIRDLKRAFDIYKGGKTFATIGVHEDARPEKGGISTALVAAANHFGTKRIPARPFLDKGVEREKATIASDIAKTLAAGKSPEEAIERAALLAVRGVQKQIDETLSPPNSKETIARKGSSHPLIDTGNMRQSISYKLHGRSSKQWASLK